MPKENLDEFDEMEEDTQKDKYLTFSLGNDFFGIDMFYVTEIIGIQPITPVPHLPNYIKGIINLRGKINPVMDVRIKFKKEEREYDERTCIVLIDVNDISIGLIVDRVSEVVVIPEINLSAPPKLNKNTSHNYIKSIGKIEEEVKLILDCEKLLAEKEVLNEENIQE